MVTAIQLLQQLVPRSSWRWSTGSIEWWNFQFLARRYGTWYFCGTIRSKAQQKAAWPSGCQEHLWGPARKYFYFLCCPSRTGRRRLLWECHKGTPWVFFCDRIGPEAQAERHLAVGVAICRSSRRSWSSSGNMSSNNISSMRNTPYKINMKPTNHSFRKENDLPNLHDFVNYVPCWSSGVYEWDESVKSCYYRIWRLYESVMSSFETSPMDRLLSRHNSTARLGSALEVGMMSGKFHASLGISWQLQSLNVAV